MKALLTIVTVFISVFVYGQETNRMDTINGDLILDKLATYNKSHPSLSLFLHIDKTIYTNNESIWFSAYLLSKNSASVNEHSVLSVLLINVDNPATYFQAKYSMELGKCAGSLLIPDSIIPGHYQLVAYTNVVDSKSYPVVIFKQAISIKTTNKSDFVVRAKLLDSLPESRTIRVQLNVSNSEGNLINGAGISYQLNKNTFKNSSTDNEGKSIISLARADLISKELLISVKYKDRQQYLNVSLPFTKDRKLSVHFYPEGGSLCYGTINSVAWETKKSDNAPVSATAVLYRDELVIDTISTDSYGIGVFKILVNDSGKYRIKIINTKHNEIDSIYQLPRPVIDIVSLHIDKAVINDTLHFTIVSPISRTINVLVHNYRSAYSFFPLVVSNKERRVTVALNEMPKGVAAITILDNEGRPLAERLFFAHYDLRITAVIKTDKTQYEGHEKITVKLKLADQNHNLVDGLISIACVQASRVEQKAKQDINSYVYFIDELGHLPYLEGYNQYDNPTLLEDILLTKGWRKYTWQDFIKPVTDNASLSTNLLTYTGYVQAFGRAVTKSIALGLVSDSNTNIIYTDNMGLFTLKNEDLTVRDKGKRWLLVNNKGDFSIAIHDPYIAVNKQLCAELAVKTEIGNITTGTAGNLVDFEKTVTLSEVILKSKKSFSPFFERNTEVKGFNTNACGDYVCAMYGDLNCSLQFHDLNNTLAPVKGRIYRKLIFDTGGRLIMWLPERYLGCSIEESDTKFVYVPTIYQKREFYGTDYDSPSSPSTQFLSTLYWNPTVEVKNGEATCIFNTSDITGKFNIDVQGVSTNDVLNGEANFTVKKQ